MNDWLWLEFPHQKNHWNCLSTPSKSWICAACGIYALHCCCTSGTKVLGPKEMSERTATSNRGMGTLLCSRNRKEENSSFPHNHSKWFKTKWGTAALQTVGANEYILQSDEDLWAECIWHLLQRVLPSLSTYKSTGLIKGYTGKSVSCFFYNLQSHQVKPATVKMQ